MTAEATARTVVHPVLHDAIGAATVVAHTVVHEGGTPARAVALVDIEGGRTIARCGDRDVVVSMTETDWVGHPVRVVAPGTFEVD